MQSIKVVTSDLDSVQQKTTAVSSMLRWELSTQAAAIWNLLNL